VNAETGFADNELLFGFDPTERIIAVEFAPPNIVVVFVRQPDGMMKASRERFRPFAWQESEPGVLKARYFRDWRSLPRGKDKGGHDRVLADPANQYLLGSGRTLFKGMRFEDLRRMQIDIETAISRGYEFSVPERDQLLAIAVADSSGWEELIVIEEDSADSERRALERFSRLIAERDPDVIEGHNVFKFDLPFLAERAGRLGVRLAFGRDGSVLKRGERPSRFPVGGRQVEFPAFRAFGRHIVDTYLLAQAYDVVGRQLESHGLKAIAAALGVREPGRIVLEGADIQRAYREDREAFRAYALTDVRETRAVSGILSRSYFVQAQIFPYNYQDVIIRGTATKIDSLFLREYLRRGVDIPLPPEKREFEGALCKVHATGVINNVWHCDVARPLPFHDAGFWLPAQERLSRDLWHHAARSAGVPA
jgi:DNA polymerase elongation subunit (family B)